jgi:elongation factor Ts
MAEITASMVKDLRETTNVGMMECKRALEECNGDKDEAIKLLRERGIAIAGKKAEREASQGLIDAAILDEGRKGVMIKINCETDFVARNENFQNFVKLLLEKAKTLGDGELADAEKDALTAKVAEIGENMKIAGNVAYEVEGAGLVVSYIHMGGKVGVLLELGFGKEDTAQDAKVQELAKDLTLQIAASSPDYLDRGQVPEAVIAEERDIFAKQMQDKPAAILDKIIDGKMNKFYAENCLLEQAFVKDPEQSITKLIDSVAKQVDDTISVKRYARYQIGA